VELRTTTNSALTFIGTISQWGEVKKKHEKKPKESAASSSETASSRGRGRGNFESRGRGRGTERGARGTRGARVASQANGTKHTSKPIEDGWVAPAATTEATGGWDSAPTNGETPSTNAWSANEPGQDALSSLATDEPKPAPAAAPPGKKAGTWASLLAKSPAPKPAPASVPTAQPEETHTAAASVPVGQDSSLPEPIVLPPIEPQIVEDGPSELPSAPHSETAVDVTPSKDELTETNLEQLPDVSHPPTSQTAASTTASTLDPLAQVENAKTPVRPVSGYAATALKATGGAGRSASFVRKVMEQHEAVVMPGNHAVEKTAVQFGKMGLNGDGDVDVDEDREEPETRTQLPDDSPAAPRASLPPSLPETQASGPIDLQPAPEAQPIPRQAPGLPPAPQQPQQAAPTTAPGFPESYRYGQGQKAYDPFGQPPSQTQVHTQGQHQEPFSNQVPGQSQPSSAQTDYSNYYGRDGYQQYYGGAGYAQAQEAHRAASTFGTSSQETPGQYATARPQQAFGQNDAQHSGQNTPAPGLPNHQTQPSHTMGGQSAHGAYPYGYGAYNQQYPQYGQSYMSAQMSHRYGANRPMFDDARRQDGSQGSEYYGNQYAYGQNQQYGSYKSNMYGQPGQQYSYDQHSSSPANVGSYGGREAMYGRSGSAQPSEAQQSAPTGHGYGGMPDPFGRTSSGFGQTQALSQQHNAHQGSEDPAKPTGPSPSMQGGRPNSTVNNSQGQQGSFPPQSQHAGQQAFGAYPQYGGGFGNFSGQQSAAHQSSGYGGYGSNAFSSYGGYGGGRGWNH
jgi:hypothetical protein